MVLVATRSSFFFFFFIRQSCRIVDLAVLLMERLAEKSKSQDQAQLLDKRPSSASQSVGGSLEGKHRSQEGSQACDG